MKKKQSDAGVIRERLAWIEQSIANGVRHEAIVEELAFMGFEMSLITFRTGLSRARAKVRQGGKVHQGQGNQPASSVTEEGSNKAPEENSKRVTLAKKDETPVYGGTPQNTDDLI